MSATYGWIVTKDHLFDPAFDEKEASGLVGPRGISREIRARLERGEGKRWLTLDDDGEKYFEGLYINEDDSEGMEPLDDFATPFAGATTIKFWRGGKGGGWKVI